MCILTTLLSLLSVFVVSYCDNEVEQAFRNSDLSPDIINDPPKTQLEVIYAAGKVNLGNELTPTQVVEPPEINYEGNSNDYYTLIFTDPDAPSRTNHPLREWHHWLVVNIPGNKVSDGEVITEYVGSAPPAGTGFHRYTFLLFKQPQKLLFDEPHYTNHDGNRGIFSTQKFIEKYGLGEAIAGNFYKAQYDDLVPSLHKQLGIGDII